VPPTDRTVACNVCDTESAPEFTKTCTPDSDRNDLTGTNPKAANYVGRDPGNAYMELQLYPPGYVEQFDGTDEFSARRRSFRANRLGGNL